MKNLHIYLVLCFFAIQAQAYDWELYSPPGVVAQKVHFFESFAVGPATAVFTYNGFYLADDIESPIWQFYDIPATDAASYNADTILIIINEGSYSDGIYFLDVNTHQYSLLEFCVEPNFILKERGELHYFVGYEHGLCESEDGEIWDAVAIFSGDRCMDMANGNQDVFALACDYDENNVFMSYDDGNTWEQKMFPAQFFEIAYAGGGPYSRPVGVCNGILGGLYKFEDDNWEVLYYSLAIQALGHSSYSDPYIGWYTGMPPDIGIAAFNTYNPSAGIYYVYEGLPNTNVFSIAEISLLTVGIQWVCCCTDEGAYLSYGIDVGQEELPDHIEQIHLYPNPLTDKLNISLPKGYNGNLKITFMDMGGKEVLNTIVYGGTKIVDVNNLLPGIYIASIRNNSGTILHSEKIIKL